MKRRSLKSAWFTAAGVLIVNTFGFITGGAPEAAPKRSAIPSYSAVEGQVEKQNKDGNLEVVYSPSTTFLPSKLKTKLKVEKPFEAWTAPLNEAFVLPTDLTINLKDCGAKNAFYNSATQEVTICYELMNYFAKEFSSFTKSDEALADAVVDATTFVLFHELGHALIDVLNLPTTGKEEDAADQFATVLLTQFGEEGEQAIQAAAASLYLGHSEENKSKNLPYWDKHSLDIQRFYGIVCLMYGSNPTKHAALVSQRKLPEERAQSCPAEYSQARANWGRLIEPYVQSYNP